MPGYQTEFRVNYYEINSHGEASPFVMLNYLEEAAIRHSESVGCGIGKLLERGQGWFLTRWSFRMKRYPKWNETIQVETWPCKFERFYATREFKITDREGSVLGVATSLWVFFDMRRKRPVRVPQEITDSYGTSPLRMVEDPFEDLPKLDQVDGALDFRVRLSDIDSNEHVNNTRYVEWLLETVPLKIHKEYLPVSVEVAYKKAAVYGEQVQCEVEAQVVGAGQRDGGSRRSFLHRILDKATGAELCCARIVWQDRG